MNMIPKYHFEVIKTVIKLLLFVLRRCWLQSLTLLLLAFLIFYWFGFLILLLTIVIYFIGKIYFPSRRLKNNLIVFYLGVVYKMCDYFLYHPDDPPDARTNITSPALLRLPYESQFITTNDGVAINVVLIKQEPEAQFKAAPTLIYFHGNAGNIGHRLQNAAELFHSLRCNVLLVEYRGYGLSQGYPTEQGLYLDSEAALKYLLNHPGINKNLIFLFGRSLGGAVAINLAQNELLSTYLAAAVIENTFTSIPEIARSLFSFRFIRKIPDWFYKNQFCSVEKIGSVTIPILFISGLCDELVPPKMMTTLYQVTAFLKSKTLRRAAFNN